MTDYTYYEREDNKERLHPLDELPAGPWEGASLEAVADCTDLQGRTYKRGSRGIAWHSCPTSVVVCPGWGAQPLDAWALNLRGPYRLSIKAMAAQVADRLRTCPQGDADYVARWLFKNYPWYRDITDNTDQGPVANITAAASYLTLTDRLAKALNMELRNGEVAAWEYAIGAWRIGGGPRGYSWRNFGGLPEDWLAALRSAVETVEGDVRGEIRGS